MIRFMLLNARWLTESPPVSALDVPEGEHYWEEESLDGLVFSERGTALANCATFNAEKFAEYQATSLEGCGWYVVVEIRPVYGGLNVTLRLDTRTGTGRSMRMRDYRLKLVRPTADEVARHPLAVAV